MKIQVTIAKMILVLLTVVMFGGCAATQVALTKKDLDVQARTSTAIFVDPVPRDQRTVYLDIKSGVQEFNRQDFKRFVKEQFTTANDNGYQIVDDPETAHFQMVVYVLNLEKTSPTAAEAALNQGFMGSMGTSVVAGAATGAVIGGDAKSGVVGGLVGGTADFISGALVKDVTYMLVADIQVKEKARKGVMVRKDTKVDTKVSDAGSSSQTVSEVSNMKEYRTRIVTTANKVNLKMETCKEPMFQKTAYAMAGFF